MKVATLVFGWLVLALCLAPEAVAQNDGPEWVEGSNGTGDAGDLPGNSQNTSGEGPMLGLRGGLGSPLDGGDTEDMYWIFIEDPKIFRATTSIEFNGFSDFDSQLWLFRPGTFGEGGGVQGFGLLGNDEAQGLEPGASMLLRNSTDNSGAFVAEPGLYLLAITRFDNDPLSDGGLIFNQTSRFEISGPDGPGGTRPILGWTGEGEGGDGNIEYRIRLEGVTFANLPAPGAIGLLCLAGAIGHRRRRR
jgi:hypothetical protein